MRGSTKPVVGIDLIFWQRRIIEDSVAHAASIGSGGSNICIYTIGFSAGLFDSLSF